MIFRHKILLSLFVPFCLAAVVHAGPYKEAAGRLSSGLPVKAKVAILPFFYIGGPERSRGGEVVAERLAAEMAGNKKLRLLERALLDKVLGEMKLDASGLAGEDGAREAGELLAADFVIIGSLYRDNAGRLEFNARAVETATGRIAGVAAAYGLAADWLEGLPSFPGGKMPENAVFKLCWAGLRALDRGDGAAAVEKFSQALKEDDTGACGLDSPGLGWRARGQARLTLGDFAGALKDLAAGLGAAPGDAELLSARAEAYIILGRPTEAIMDLDALVKAAPGDARAWLRRGMAQAIWGGKEAAVGDLNRALALGSRDPRIYAVRGAMLLFLGRLAEAGRDLDKAVSLDPDLAEAYFTRGLLYGRQGRLAEALLSYDILVDLEPWRPRSYLERGTCLAAMHRFDLALSDFNKAIELDPDYAKAYCYRGMLYRTRLRNEEAVEDFDKALSLDPGYTEALMGRARSRADMGRPQEALEDLSEIIRLEKPLDSERYFSRAILLGRLGKWKRSIEDLDRYIKLVPDNPAAYEARGYSYERLGMDGKAKADLARSAELRAKGAPAGTVAGGSR